jgi:hypothetical protein
LSGPARDAPGFIFVRMFTLPAEIGTSENTVYQPLQRLSRSDYSSLQAEESE